MKTLLTISYDGTAYAGWQTQPNAPTVQQTLEAALSKLYRRRVLVLGASRTDAGVHALGQRAAFRMGEGDPDIPHDKLPYAVNTLLPGDIRILSAEAAPDSFDPIKSAKQKTYEYRIYNRAFMSPLWRLYAAHVRAPMDITAMRKACGHLVGRHDFVAFRAAGGSAATTVREIYGLSLEKRGELIVICVTGNGFLYNMVRIIAGTLVYVGMGKLKSDDIPAILASKDRVRAGKTMAAHGLLLKEVVYGDGVLCKDLEAFSVSSTSF